MTGLTKELFNPLHSQETSSMTKKNILFIMFDQLRYDYLSCAGHQTLHTPHIDRLASMGVRFSNCYVQSPICGASRMSTYTGRYVSSHGAAWNNVPLKVGEMTMGDHLRAAGMGCWLIGKTHMEVDAEGMERLGLAKESIIGARVSEAGFNVWLRDDGLWAYGADGYYDKKISPYNNYLKSKGYEAVNPWADYANAGVDEEGNITSGWFMKYSREAANIEEKDSETPWLTGEAIKFIESQKNKPWLCHLSYIKPHWPYIVPAPYHDMYGIDDIKPVLRDKVERENPHPIYKAFMENNIGKSFSRDEVQKAVIPAYMGLIKQADDQMGRLFDWLEKSNRMQDTIIVVTSDHGDYLGDHWLGEKGLFHAQSVKAPLIVYDPSAAADSTRGMVSDALVEAIDLTASFVDYAKEQYPDHVLEGESLWPIIHGKATDTGRSFVVSEYDYSQQQMAKILDIAPRDARLFMLADKQWKFIHAEGGLRPMLFDIHNDPQEFYDLGASTEHQDIIDLCYQRLGEWARRMAQRTTITDDNIRQMREMDDGVGIMLGIYDESEVTPEAASFYQGKAYRRYEPK